MAGKSDYAEQLVLELLTGRAPSATRYIGLFTAAPSDSGGGTEVSGNNYARKSTAGGTSGDWAAVTGTNPTSIANANAITFATPSGSWGTVTHFGVFDASSGGNLLSWASLTVSKTIGSGDSAAFAAGSLALTED